MKVIIAGATGAIGTPLAARLIADGHEVAGLTRTQRGAARLTAVGVQPIVADAMDRSALLRALDGHTADAVIHELTALAKAPLRHSHMTETNRLRTDGTRNLLEAARVVGARRFVTQSIVLGYGYTDHGSKTLTEDDPFGREQGPCAPHLAAMAENERLAFTAAGIEGVALRYGMFYGRDMSMIVEMLRKRRMPVVAGKDRPLSWIHLDDAAAATAAALTLGEAGTAYNIVDDEPCSWARMMTATAEVFGAPAPRALPGWVVRLAAPYAAALTVQTAMRVSNAKAKEALGWKPAYPTYQEGLRAPTTEPAPH
ncbi:NAD-dependent epimerase/dehydratase family protein [Amycolatopsis taiwanensis]|uniref:NAD(P)-dependent oxidoreductase n=1 Tax=Amycolatopsis taiwanensis TaxID=342230 RepID=A0A9W6QWU4_9PSEU|nr:NAD(P)-dependent oxidoreductase [Amycolatopsis taiwanensis]GLY64380.1 NAD(P)-dependent oxidoreductase [Amycolatopsis taiwanensis]